MKYIFLNNLNSLKKSKKIIFLFALSLVLFLYVAPSLKIKNIPIKTLGLIFPKEFLEILIYVLNFAFYSYIIFSLFLSDFKMGGQNIFPRMKKKQYIAEKLFSIFVILTILKTFFHILVSIKCLNFEFIIWLKDILFSGIFLSFLIFFLFFFSLNKKICIIVMLLFLGLILKNKEFFSIISYDLFFLIFLNIVLSGITLFLSKYLFQIYERND